MRVPWTAGRSIQFILKEISPGYALEGMMLKLKLQYFSHLMDCSKPGYLSITNSQSLLKLMSIELVRPSNHLVLCCPLLLPSSIFPSFRVFPMSQLFASGGQSIGASATVFPMNIQGWFPLGLTGLISLQLKELSRVFSNITVQKHQFFSTQPSLWSNFHIRTES